MPEERWIDRRLILSTNLEWNPKPCFLMELRWSGLGFRSPGKWWDLLLMSLSYLLLYVPWARSLHQSSSFPPPPIPIPIIPQHPGPSRQSMNFMFPGGVDPLRVNHSPLAIRVRAIWELWVEMTQWCLMTAFVKSILKCCLFFCSVTL